jgi:hypothetical protein
MNNKNLLYSIAFVLTFVAGFLGLSFYQNQPQEVEKNAKAEESITIELKRGAPSPIPEIEDTEE